MMTEIHAHVIYGVDDGPQTREEMEKMLYVAARSGVERLFCTSHVELGSGSFAKKAYEQHLEEARAWCADNAPQLRLYAGAEVFYEPGRWTGSLIPTLEGTNLVLTEFLPNISAGQIEAAVAGFKREGLRVILAHVERYRCLRPSVLARLRADYGTLAQMNAQTVFDEECGFFRRRRVMKLIESGSIDFVASDAHEALGRGFCLQYARHWLERHCGAETADRLCGWAIDEAGRETEQA